MIPPVLGICLGLIVTFSIIGLVTVFRFRNLPTLPEMIEIARPKKLKSK
jgi:uncharacterized membrane protein